MKTFPVQPSLNATTQRLQTHYSQKFAKFGATPKGVDWGKDEDVRLRYDKMLAVIHRSLTSSKSDATLLDVGCGYGGLYVYAKEKGVALRYTGIDVAKNMIKYASVNIPDARFYCVDVFRLDSRKRYDYVVCNGILTQKLATGIREMDRYAHALIKKLFSHCIKGVAFNVMTTRVNYTVENLYYRSPVELFAYCFAEVSDKIKIDHAYPLYEYTMYLYRS